MQLSLFDNPDKDKISTKIVIKISQEFDWNVQNEMWEKLKIKKGMMV